MNLELGDKKMLRNYILSKQPVMDKRILWMLFLVSSFTFAQTTVTLEDQCNCEVLQGTDVSVPGVNSPVGADLGDLYVNTTSGTIFFWDGDSWEFTTTDDQQLTGFTFSDITNELTLDLENGGSVTVDLSSLEDTFSDANTTITSFDIDSVSNSLVITDSDSNSFSISLISLASIIDTNIFVTDFVLDAGAGELAIIDNDGGEFRVSLSDIAAATDTNTTNATFSVDAGTNELVIFDSEGDDVRVALADIAALVNTDDQTAGEVAITAAGNITSTDVQSALEELDGDITGSELTTTVIEGAGTDVATTVVGNNTEYAVSTEVSAAAGNALAVVADGLFATDTDDQNASEVAVTAAGNITSTDVQSALEELDGDITGSELTTSVVGGNGIDVSSTIVGNNTEYDVEVNIGDLTGDGSIGSVSGAITVGGGANAVLADVDLDLSDNSVTCSKIADGTIDSADINDGAVTLSKIEDGTSSGQVIQWNGSGWTLVDLGSVTVTENDGVIGNEVTGATDGTLTLSGGATTLNPLTLGVSANGITSTELADNAVTPLKIDASLAGTGLARSAAGVLSVDGSSITPDWTNITNIPAGFADDIDNDTQLTDAEVATAVNNEFPNLDTDSTDDFDGVWGSLTAVPAGFADNTDDNTEYTAGAGLDLTGTVFSVDGSSITPDWTNITNIPAGFADDVDNVDDADSVIGNESVTSLTFDGTTLTLTQDGAANETVNLSSVDTDDQNASQVSITDADGNFTSGDVEGALDELADSITANTADGTETIIDDGSANPTYDISVSGDGSAGDPYVIRNTRPNIFYPPSIAIDASTLVNNVTVDLYQQYLDQYDGSASNFTASAGAPATVPFYGPTDLYYYVTFADPAVLNIDSINASGVLQYDVVGTPPDYNSLINVVFVVK